MSAFAGDSWLPGPEVRQPPGSPSPPWGSIRWEQPELGNGGQASNQASEQGVLCPALLGCCQARRLPHPHLAMGRRACPHIPLHPAFSCTGWPQPGPLPDYRPPNLYWLPPVLMTLGMCTRCSSSLSLDSPVYCGTSRYGLSPVQSFHMYHRNICGTGVKGRPSSTAWNTHICIMSALGTIPNLPMQVI